MKQSICYLAALFLTISLPAQSFQVIKVAGLITQCESGDTLRMEDKIEGIDSLCFVNTEKKYAVAAIIDLDNKDRFLIKAADGKAGIHKNMVGDILTRSRTRTGTRRGKLNNLLDLRTFFGSADFLILGDSLPLALNAESLAMNADSFFYASYQYRGETINKKLPFENDELILSRNDLFRVDDLPIDEAETSDFTLYYFQPKLKQRREVASFTPQFISDASIVRELDILYAALKGSDTESLKQALATYLIEVYGKADDQNISRCLEDYLRKKQESGK